MTLYIFIDICSLKQSLTQAMILAIMNYFKGRLTKESIEEARSSTKRMSRQEALQQMRRLASKQPGKEQ